MLALPVMSLQEAQLSPRDRAMRCVNWNLANCHATVQKLLIRQVLAKSMVWSWRFSRRQCRDRQCALNHDTTESAAIVSGVINKPTTVELCISRVYDDLLWQNFLSPQCRNCSRDPDHAHLGSTHSSQDLRLHMADPCTKSEVSSVSRCGDITWGVKF